MSKPAFLIKKLFPEALLPKKGSESAAGYDLHSISDQTIAPKDKAIIKTGLVIISKQGYKSAIWQLRKSGPQIRSSGETFHRCGSRRNR